LFARERQRRRGYTGEDVPDKELYRAASAIWRLESAKLLAVLARTLRDINVAEDLAHELFLEALARWEVTGIPENPAGWLMLAARHRALDHLRHQRMRERKHDALTRELPSYTDASSIELEASDVVGDELLRLIFVACHPVLSQESSVALTLRLLCGLTTDEIARAFLVPEPTIAQRITRAKRTLAERDVAFELPGAADLESRLAAVLEVIYLVFNEGYAASAGDDAIRPSLCEEALRLGRILAELVPNASEALGLVALMEIQASRMRARTAEGGELVLLQDQDRSKWDRVLVDRGLSALERASALLEASAQPTAARPGPYLLQAAIAACHARAKTAAGTDWARIAALYEVLAQVSPSPIVELNRAVAVGMALGAQAGLSIVDTLSEESSLREYAQLPSVRAHLLAKLGRFAEAAEACARALALTKNAAERAKLRERLSEYERGEADSR
jgi:RNA polymerase sigma-70 factor (ECF subfamily)